MSQAASATLPARSTSADCVAAPTSSREWGGLLLILIVGLIVRVPFWPRTRDLGDALNYAIGALDTHVAHPPGSDGYCVLMGLLNLPIRNISFTMVLASVVAATLSTFVCHRVAKWLGMGTAAALSATALYCFSINTLQASLLGGPHIFEGLASLLLGGLVWKAVCSKRLSVALLATVVFAASGALRPTTTLLMIPLWLWMLIASGPTGLARRAKVVALHLLIAVPVVGLWSWGNSHYMAAAGYGGQTYQNQVLITSTYDYANLSATTTDTRQPSQLTFHMPGAELLAWAEVKTGLRFMPHVPGWPTPSLSRALHLLLMQTLKQGWWLALSLPISFALPIVALIRRQLLSEGDRQQALLLLLWIVPSVAFFIFGHLGTLTYVQVYLGAMCLLTAKFLVVERPTEPRFNRRAVGWVAACVAVNILFYTAARPIAGNSPRAVSLDLVLLQFDGYSRAHAFAASRNTGTSTGTDEGAAREYHAARTDEELLQAARRNGFEYMSPADRASAQPR